MNLENIKSIITAPDFNELKALHDHREKLLAKKEQLELLIANVEKTISSKERGILMNDKEAFAGFKKKLIEDNEKKYGQEVREKYGDKIVNTSNAKLLNMTQEEYAEITRLGEEVIETLTAAFQTGDPAGELAQKAADLHRQWLTFYWDNYTKEAHAGLAQMYVDDARFTAYYDKKQPGLARFLRDAVLIYTGMNKQES